MQGNRFVHQVERAGDIAPRTSETDQSLLLLPVERHGPAHDALQCHVRRQGTITDGDLDPRRQERERAALADEGTGAVWSRWAMALSGVPSSSACLQRCASLRARIRIGSGAGRGSPITSFASTPRRRSLSGALIS